MSDLVTKKPSRSRTPRKKAPVVVAEKAEDLPEEALEEALEVADEEESQEEDRISAISFLNRGPRMGTMVYLPGGSGDNIVSFGWRDTRTGDSVKLPQPLAVRVKREGGTYYRLELFFPDRRNKDTALERFDNTTFTVKTGRNPVTGKAKGHRFKALVGAGWGRDRLPELDSDLRFLKYVVHTSQMDHFEDAPTHLKGLAAPYKAS